MTFKELAKFILSQPEDFQNCEASITNLDEGESASLSEEHIKIVGIVDDVFAPLIFGTKVGYKTIATSKYEIECDEYRYDG